MQKEVRMGAMKNIHVLLKECSMETRIRFMPYIMQTSETTQYDWRLKFLGVRDIRFHSIDQYQNTDERVNIFFNKIYVSRIPKFVTASLIGHLSQLYDESTVYDNFLPTFFKLSFDPVAKVSETAALCLPLLLQSFSPNRPLQLSLMRMVLKYFQSSETYKRRQLFVLMCGEAINQSKQQFYEHFLHPMVELVHDRVISVRMALARVLRQHYVTKLTESLVGNKEISRVVKILQKDKSSDIRQLVASIPYIEVTETEASENPLEEYASSQKESILTREPAMSINDTIDDQSIRESRFSTNLDQQPKTEQSADALDFELEIMIQDAIEAAQQQYFESQSKLRASVMAEEGFK